MSFKAPTDSMIINMVKRFKDTGSIEDNSKVRLESTHNDNEAKITIIDFFLKFPNLSIHNKLGILSIRNYDKKCFKNPIL